MLPLVFLRVGEGSHRSAKLAGQPHFLEVFFRVNREEDKDVKKTGGYPILPPCLPISLPSPPAPHPLLMFQTIQGYLSILPSSPSDFRIQIYIYIYKRKI